MTTQLDLSTLPTRLLINGQWVEGSARESIAVVDPATEEHIATVASASEEDALVAVSAAHSAIPPWSTSSPRVRSEVLRRAFDIMIEQRERLAELIVRENGKALADAVGEVNYAAEFFRWYAEEAVRAFGQVGVAPSGTNRIVVLHQPVGVCVLVTPWNFPAAMATRKIGPALAAGNAVVLKPASATPLTALAIAEILQQAGVPDGVVNVIPSSRSGSVVSRMVHDPRVRKLSFTGSTEVGRMLLHEAADTVVNCAMELGGNAPFVVFDDADLDAAIEGAMIAKMRNGGEACTAANRFFVQDAVAEEFTARLSAAMGALRVGHGLAPGVQVGPLVDGATRDKVVSLVQDAVGQGAKVRLGGVCPDGPGFFYPPTVLTDVDRESPILGEEIFGPVAPIVRFASDDDAIQMANDTEYGLVAYVYTTDLARGLRASEAIEAGMIGLNRGLVSDPAAPFGGVKQSGVGREGGHEGLLDYLETKYIATNW